MQPLALAQSISLIGIWGLTFLALAIFASPAVLADDPVAGATLYASKCSSCHGSNPLTSNSNKIYNGRNARAVIGAVSLVLTAPRERLRAWRRRRRRARSRFRRSR